MYYQDYRESIIQNAANNGILLTSKLLNLAFDPIEASLLEAYKAVYDHDTQEKK